MPSSQKVAWSQLRVGVMAIVALSLLAALVFLMTGADNPFEEKATLYTYMMDSAAMTDGSAVRLNGILIGKVKRIEITGDADNSRAVKMTLVVDRAALPLIPEDSIISFSAENVLGSKFLNIRRGTSRKTVADGGTLQARDDKDFLEVVQSAMPLLDSMQSILHRIDGLIEHIESGRGNLGRLIKDEQLYARINNTLADVQEITAAVRQGKGTIGHLVYDEDLYNDLRRTLSRVDNVAAGLERGEGTAGKLLKDPALYDELRATSRELHTLIENLNKGEGTAGKLLRDEALHNQIVATLSKVNSTIDRLNAGQGTLGQLMVNPALYENLAVTTSQMSALMRDFRANPKKFLTIQLKLF